MASPRPLALPNRLAETLIEGLGEALAKNDLPSGLLRRADALQDLVDPPSQSGHPGLRSGAPPLDALLSGGLRRGSFVELAGPLCSGRTSCAHALLATATRNAHAAWVDLADSFDPPSADTCGADLTRVLWARAPSPQVALRACERLLLSRAFELVVLDFALASKSGVIPMSRRGAPPTPAPKKRWGPPSSAWVRLQRSAVQTGCVLLLLSAEPLAGAVPTLTLLAHPAEACFRDSPAWFEGVHARIDRVRDRRRPDEQSAVFPLALDPEVPPRARGLPADSRSARRCDTARAS